MALLELQEVSKRYVQGGNDVVALSQVDLTVEEGEALALIGPSGSGKSTLLHLAGALLTSGAIAAIVVLAAAAWPARRAADVEVLDALRYE